jgi:hypothetical protein
MFTGLAPVVRFFGAAGVAFPVMRSPNAATAEPSKHTASLAAGSYFQSDKMSQKRSFWFTRVDFPYL